MVGSGSTATQVVPAIQPIAKKIYLFQREPGWVMPKGERDLTEAERAVFAKRWRRALDRWRLRYVIEKGLWGGGYFALAPSFRHNGNGPALTTSHANSPTVPIFATLSPRRIPTPASGPSSPARTTPP